jgi:hypothetical protein
MNTGQSVFKILVISEFVGGNANVIRDFLFCFNKYSRHDFYYIFDPKVLDDSFDFSAFDAILVFWSVYLPGASLSGVARRNIKSAKACKLLFLQDEYRNVHMFNQIMNDLGIELMFTCVAEKDHEIFYPSDQIPSLRATYTVLTGYVPSYLETYRPRIPSARNVDIAYRSRSLPYFLGDLGREKTIIAERFQEISQQYGFRADISVSEEDRIYGDEWVNFLRSSRFVLGSPSGASVIDFTGDIGRNCKNYLALYPDASYEDVKQQFFADVDGKIVIDTVSPRIFESTALSCTMIMHEGYYGGILEAGRHYICVRKDYSNLNEVIAQMRDERFCDQIARNAYRDLIVSRKYSYQGFAAWFDGILDKHVYPTPRTKTPSKLSFYARNYVGDGQAFVPYSDRVYTLPFLSTIQKYHLMMRSLHHISICFSSPEIKRLLGKYLLNKYLGKLRGTPIEPKPILMDLARLSILSHIILEKGAITGEFRIRLEKKADTNVLRFISYHSREGDDHLAAGCMAADELGVSFNLDSVVSALSHRKFLLEWDHSPVATYIEYEFKSRSHALDMGLDGHYQFQSIPFQSEQYPDLVADVLRPITDKLKNG